MIDIFLLYNYTIVTMFIVSFFMKITYLSIFPELFDSFISTTLISRAVKNKKLKFETLNPRHFCDDKHRIVDDEIYGWWHGLLMKAPPIIAWVQHWITKNKLTSKKNNKKRAIILPHPSITVFNQSHAHTWSEYSHLLFICGRYEWIDERVWLWLQREYSDHCYKVSLGQFVTLGGELPAMTMTESIVRLIPGVINTEMSWVDESYSREHNLQNIEYAQYTRPEIVEDMVVPEVLLSGHHKNIQQWKTENSKIVKNL